ncbi:MAG: NlpC/P60 family protein [Rhizobiaceae bacterium]
MPVDQNEVRSAVVREAESWIGTPYRHQGSKKGVACDCLGLVRGIWRAIYGCEPESPGAYAPDWAEAGSRDRLLEAADRLLIRQRPDNALPGDLLLFRWRPGMVCKHAGIVVKDDRFIHAYQGHAVVSSPLVHQWRRRIAASHRFPAFSLKDR